MASFNVAAENLQISQARLIHVAEGRQPHYFHIIFRFCRLFAGNPDIPK
jgi:hypothetical protein